MDYTDFNNLYLNGLFRDSYEAEMNFAIYKKIKNVWGKLASLEKNEQRLFVYLKQAATLKTVLSLAKLYDKKNKKYPTRCIESLFEELEKSDFEIQNNYVDQLNWDKFSKSNTLVIKTIFNGDEPNAKEFIPYFKHYIEESMKKEIEPFKTLKTWRDKRIAHNENFGGFNVDGSGQNVLMSGWNLPGSGTGSTSASFVMSLSAAGTLNWGYNSTQRNFFYGLTAFANKIVNVGMGRSIFVGVPDFPVVNIINTDGAGLCDSTLLPMVITDFTLDNASGTTTENSTSAFTAVTSSVSYINTVQFTRAMICVSEPSVGLDVEHDLSSWSIYPNPANESISVVFNSEEIVALRIVDLSEKEVLSVSDYFTDSPLDVSHLTPGFYMIQMHRDGHKMTSRKLIKN